MLALKTSTVAYDSDALNINTNCYIATYEYIYMKVIKMKHVIKHSCQIWKLANARIAQHLSWNMVSSSVCYKK
jgi:hypothetical protein